MTRLAWLPLVAGLAACDALLTDPAPPPATVDVQFQIEGAFIGGPSAAFAKVRRVGVRFVRPDSAFRDTVFAVAPVDGAIRIPVALEVDERIEALGIGARLGIADLTLFEGASVVRIEPGVPTSATIPVVPVPGRIQAAAPVVPIANVGDVVTLEASVLFATLDTIPGLTGTWLSEDPGIVSVTADGRATLEALGQTRLEVRYDTLADTIIVGAAPVATVEVSSTSVSALPGELVTLTAVLRDALGNELTGRTVTWGSVNPAVATVDASGTILAVTPGTTTVVASSGGVTTAVAVTVLRGTNILRWTNPSGGAWSDPANWDAGVAPSATDSVEITLDGSYTVVMDVDASVASLTLSPVTGPVELQAAGRAVFVTGDMTLGGEGRLVMSSSTTVSGGGLVNASSVDQPWSDVSITAPVDNRGAVTLTGSATIAGGLVTAPGSTLRIVSTGPESTVVIATGMTNTGTLQLDATAGPVSLGLGGATLLNDVGGSLLVTGSSPVRIFAPLDNRGTITSTLTAADLVISFGFTSSHLNSGSISLSGGGSLYFTDVVGFENTGSIDVSGGELGVFGGSGAAALSLLGSITTDATGFVQFNRGTLTWDVDALVTGAGTMAMVNVAPTLPDLTLGTNAPANLVVVTSNVPAGTIQVPAGTGLILKGGTIGANLDVAGSLLIGDARLTGEGVTDIGGTVTTAAGSDIAILSDTGFPTTATFTNAFTVNGVLSVAGADPATLSVLSGPLTIGATGSLDFSGLGARAVNLVTLDMQGSMSLTGTPLTVSADTVTLGAAATLFMDTDLTLTGLLQASDVVTTVDGTGSTLTTSGLNVTELTISNVRLVSNGGPLIAFDNVIFQAFPTTATQLTITNTGFGGPFTFDGLVFETTPTTGLYIQANDSDGGTPLEINLTNSTPVDGSARTAVTGGAIVIWG